MQIDRRRAGMRLHIEIKLETLWNWNQMQHAKYGDGRKKGRKTKHTVRKQRQKTETECTH